MKIQISKEPRIKDLPNIWPEEGKDVDIVLNVTAPDKFPYNHDRLKKIYDFGALGHCAPDQITPTIMQWLRALKPGGSIFIVEVNFERAVREFIGADISLDEFNTTYNRRTHIVKESLAEQLNIIGIPHANVKEWHGKHKDFDIHPHEFILEIIKP